jgi:hypothetical protein
MEPGLKLNKLVLPSAIMYVEKQRVRVTSYNRYVRGKYVQYWSKNFSGF